MAKGVESCLLETEVKEKKWWEKPNQLILINRREGYEAQIKMEVWLRIGTPGFRLLAIILAPTKQEGL